MSLIAPPINVPPSERQGTETPKLFSTVWWLWFSEVGTRMLELADSVLGWSNLTTAGKLVKVSATDGTITESSLAEADVVQGAPNLTTTGAIPMVDSVDGTLEESAISDDGATVSISEPVAITGDVDVTGVYKVGGVQVVGAQGAAVSAPTVITGLIIDTADLAYSSNERDMLNNLKASVNLLNAAVANLETAVNDLRARLAAHGLIA